MASDGRLTARDRRTIRRAGGAGCGHDRSRAARPQRRRRDDHAEPAGRDEQPRRRDQGGTARRGRHGRRRSGGPLRGADGQRTRVLRRAGPQAAHRDPRQRGVRPAVPHRRGALQPDRHHARRHGQAGHRGRQRVAAGAGATLAFACDLRILADTAGFNLAFAGVALSCDTGSSFTLQRLVGPAKAIELLYLPRTSRPTRRSPSASPPASCPPARSPTRCAALATALAAGPTVASARSAGPSAYAAGHTFEESVAFESEMMTLTGATADHRAAVDAFVAKEKPVFEGGRTCPVRRRRLVGVSRTVVAR